MKGWSLDANFQAEVLTWWVWRSLRTDIGTKLPRGSAVVTHIITDFWASHPCYTCPSSSEQSYACKLLESTAVYSFFLHKCLSSNWPKFPSAWKSSCTFSEISPPLCLPSSPWLPLWLSVALEFWELIISWRKSTRGCKQKEISMKESYLWSQRQIRSAVFNLFPETMAPKRAEVWLVLPESSVN